MGSGRPHRKLRTCALAAAATAAAAAAAAPLCSTYSDLSTGRARASGTSARSSWGLWNGNCCGLVSSDGRARPRASTKTRGTSWAFWLRCRWAASEPTLPHVLWRMTTAGAAEEEDDDEEEDDEEERATSTSA